VEAGREGRSRALENVDSGRVRAEFVGAGFDGTQALEVKLEASLKRREGRRERKEGGTRGDAWPAPSRASSAFAEHVALWTSASTRHVRKYVLGPGPSTSL
jgi:hypothetical protein